MPAQNPCSLLCFMLFPLAVAIFALYKKNYAMAVLCAVSVLLGVGPLVALLALFKLLGKQRLLDISLLIDGVVLFMMVYVVGHRFLFVRI